MLSKAQGARRFVSMCDCLDGGHDLDSSGYCMCGGKIPLLPIKRERRKPSKAQMLVDAGLADDLRDARAQLADMS
jgi:hypothetical protein